MATKTEEPKSVSTEGAGLFSGAGVEERPEINVAVDTPDKKEAEQTKVDDATAGVADLTVAEDPKVEENPAEVTPEKTVEAVPAQPAPATKDADAATATATSGPVWPETAADHPLSKFFDALESLTTEAAHNEVYGIELTTSNAFHTKLVLQKFLRANQNDLEKAKQQLLETLKWRKEFDPVKAAEESFDRSRFDGLGYVLEVEGVPESPNKKDIVTFNIYGAVKDNKATFGDLEG